MKEFTYTIEDKNGLHARPAGKLATFAKQFTSDICVSTDQKEADCKRLISLMSLGAVCGTTLHFKLTGEDEADACSALSGFCKDNLSGERA